MGLSDLLQCCRRLVGARRRRVLFDARAIQRAPVAALAIGLVFLLMMALPTAAQPQSAPPATGPDPVPPDPSAVPTDGSAGAPPLALSYVVRVGAVPMLTAELTLDLGGARWRASLDAKPVPLFGNLFKGTVAATASGGRANPAVGLRPAGYGVHILLPQRAEHTRLAYEPAAGIQIPRRVHPRPQPVADPTLAGALDPISAVAALVDRVAKAGACPDELLLFDGWRRFRIAFDSRPVATVPPAYGIAYRGPGLQCDYTVAPPDGTRAEGYLGFLTEGRIWLAAAVDGGPAVPVIASAGHGSLSLWLVLLKARRLDSVPAAAPVAAVDIAPARAEPGPGPAAAGAE